ncbi:MAG: gamma-glutamylcyclotransferase [Planctomycetaceae bacterium]
MNAIVFVYGSLKRGRALHHLLQSARFLGTASTSPLYRLFDLGHYPGLVEWPAGLSIAGELYEVDSHCLSRLDDAEGVAEGYYARRDIQLLSPAPAAQAWFWLGAVKDCPDCGSCWPQGSQTPP